VSGCSLLGRSRNDPTVVVSRHQRRLATRSALNDVMLMISVRGPAIGMLKPGHWMFLSTVEQDGRISVTSPQLPGQGSGGVGDNGWDNGMPPLWANLSAWPRCLAAPRFCARHDCLAYFRRVRRKLGYLLCAGTGLRTPVANGVAPDNPVLAKCR
jgi:hypothetical protein